MPVSIPSTPLRIAYVCTDGGIPVLGSKGASVHAQAVLRELCSAGHDVHLLTPRPGPVDHPLRERLTIHQLPPVVGDSAADREAASRSSDRQVGAVLDTIAPDLVYERYALWGRTATSWSRDRGVRSVLEVNAPLVEEQLTHRELTDVAGAYTVARDACESATAVVCVSEPVADWVRDIGPMSGRITVLPNGVDVERIRPAQRPVRPTEDPDFTVGFLGTLKGWHGVDVLVAALVMVQDRAGRSPRLLVVGDGPKREALQAATAAAGIEAHFTGAVPPHDVAQHLHRMDIACAPYPARPDHYFSPLKVFEYFAAGLPVVASAVGQLPELLDHGRLGRLVRPGDAAALAASLVELRVDAVERRRLGVEVRRAAVARHTWAGVVDRSLAAAGVGLRRHRVEPAEAVG